MPFGMDIGKIIAKSAKIGEKMREIRTRLAEKTVEGSAGGGMVKVVVSGDGEVLSIKADNDIISTGDTGLLLDLVRAAVNDGLKKSRELMEDEIKKVGEGLGLPLDGIF